MADPSDDLPASHLFDVMVERGPEAARVRLDGELDMATAPILAQAFTELVIQRVPQIIVDLQGLDFIASAGLQLLAQLHADTTSAGLAVTFVGASPGIRRVVALAGLQDRIAFSDAQDW